MTKKQIKDMLGALKEGKTEDRDLQKTIDSAKKAIDSLKKYLKQ